jgi:hypothetical protein
VGVQSLCNRRLVGGEGSLVRTRLSLLSREDTGNSAGFGAIAARRGSEKRPDPATFGGISLGRGTGNDRPASREFLGRGKGNPRRSVGARSWSRTMRPRSSSRCRRYRPRRAPGATRQVVARRPRDRGRETLPGTRPGLGFPS